MANREERMEAALKEAKAAIQPLLCGPSSNPDPLLQYLCATPPVLDGHAIAANAWQNTCCYKYTNVNTFNITALDSEIKQVEAEMYKKIGYPFDPSSSFYLCANDDIMLTLFKDYNAVTGDFHHPAIPGLALNAKCYLMTDKSLSLYF